MATPINALADFTSAADTDQLDFTNITKKTFSDIIQSLIKDNVDIATKNDLKKVEDASATKAELKKVEDVSATKAEVNDVQKELNDFKPVPADNLKKVKIELEQAQKKFVTEAAVKVLITRSEEVQETQFNGLLDDIKRDTKKETEEVVHGLNLEVGDIKRNIKKHSGQFVDTNKLKEYAKLFNKSLSSLKKSSEEDNLLLKQVQEFVIQVEKMGNARHPKFTSLAEFADYINVFTKDAEPLLVEVLSLRDYATGNGRGSYDSIVDSYKALCVRQSEMRSQPSSKGNDRCRQSKKMSGSSGNSFARRYNSQGTDKKKRTQEEEMEALLNSF